MTATHAHRPALTASPSSTALSIDATLRDDFARPERVQAFRRILEGIEAPRILEIGCNVGWNLGYLAKLGHEDLWGVEPQSFALHHARVRRPRATLLPGDALDVPLKAATVDLVFTAGVLTRVAPVDLPRAMHELYRVSRRYVLYLEPDASSESTQLSPGEPARWLRDHRRAWQEACPELRVVRGGQLGVHLGFEGFSYCLFEKGG